MTPPNAAFKNKGRLSCSLIYEPINVTSKLLTKPGAEDATAKPRRVYDDD